jgi:cytochrome c-type biogenesis protein CcmH/NrfG
MNGKTRRQQIEEMLADEPNDVELRYMLAMEHASEGNDEAAVRVFYELMAQASDYPPAYHMAGRTLQRLNRLEEAREVLGRGIRTALAKGDQHAAGEMQGLLEMLE